MGALQQMMLAQRIAAATGPTIIANTSQKFAEVGNGAAPDMTLAGSNIAIFGVLSTIHFGGSPLPVGMTYENTVRGALTRNGSDFPYGFGAGRLATFVATGVPAGSRDVDGDWDETPIQAFLNAVAIAGCSGFSNWQQLPETGNYGDNTEQTPASITLTGTAPGELYIVGGGYQSGNQPLEIAPGNAGTTIVNHQFDFLGGGWIMAGVASGASLTLSALLNQIPGAGDPPGNFFSWGLRGARADA